MPPPEDPKPVIIKTDVSGAVGPIKELQKAFQELQALATSAGKAVKEAIGNAQQNTIGAAALVAWQHKNVGGSSGSSLDNSPLAGSGGSTARGSSAARSTPMDTQLAGSDWKGASHMPWHPMGAAAGREEVERERAARAQTESLRRTFGVGRPPGGGKPPGAPGGPNDPDPFMEGAGNIAQTFSWTYGQGGVARAAGIEADKALGARGGIGPVSLAMAAFGAVQKAADTAADSINTLNDGTKTAAQKMQSLSESFIPGIAILRKFEEALNGTTERIARSQREHARLAVENRTYWEREQAASGAEASQQGNVARLGGLNAFAYAGYRGGDYDRSTVSGQIGYGEYRQRLGGEDAVVRARRALEAERLASGGQESRTGRAGAMAGSRGLLAGRAMSDAQRLIDLENMPAGEGGLGLPFTHGVNAEMMISQVRARQAVAQLGSGAAAGFAAFGASRSRLDAASASSAAANSDVAQPGVVNRAARMESLNKAELANSALLTAATNSEREINSLIESRHKLIKAESDLRKAGIEQQKIEVQILEQRANRQESNQQRVGSMSDGEFEMNLQAAEHIRKNGLQNALPEVISRASRIMPAELSKMQVEYGEGRSKRLADMGFKEPLEDLKDGSLADKRGRINNLNADIRVKIDLDEKAFAQAVVDRINPLYAELLKAVDVKLKATEDAQKLSQFIRNFFGGG